MQIRNIVVFLLFFSVCGLAQASSIQNLSEFDSFVRIVLPPGTTMEVVEHSKAAARQTLKVVPALTGAQARGLEEFLESTGHTRSVAVNATEMTVQYTNIRTSIDDLGGGLWAVVVRRPKTFALAELMSPQSCMVWFSHWAEEAKVQAQHLCEGGAGWVIDPKRSGSAHRILQLLTDEAVNRHRLSHLINSHPGTVQEDRDLVHLLIAVTHLTDGRASVGFVELGRLVLQLDERRYGVLKELGEHTYERVLESAITESRDDDAIVLYNHFASWESDKIDRETRLGVASVLHSAGRPQSALECVLDVIEKHPWDRDALLMAHSYYSALALDYHAYLITRRLREM